MSKRLFVILFTGILILSLAACGGTSKKQGNCGRFRQWNNCGFWN